MAITYAQLQTALQDYLETTETTFVAQIPTFVKQAERRILNTVQLPVFRKNVTGAMTASSEYLATPTDFLAPYSLAVVSGTDHVYLVQKDVNFIREIYPNENTEGTPVHYALFDHDTFLIGPTPDASYTTQLHYFYQPQSIVDSSTSWLGDNAEDALLYGSLVEAYTFLKGEPDLLGLYDNRYKEALAMLKVLGDGKNRQDTYRNTQTRMPIQ